MVGIDPIFRGLSWRLQMEVDPHFATSIQTYLFGDPGNGATDLTARNIQRGRDHGIPDYNTCRFVQTLQKRPFRVRLEPQWVLQRKHVSQISRRRLTPP